MLFGHQNDDTNQPATEPANDITNANPLAVDSATGASLPVATTANHPAESDGEPSGPSVLNQPNVPQVTEPDASSTAPALETPPVFTPDLSAAPVNETSVDAPSLEDASQAPSESGLELPKIESAGEDLLKLKQQAISQLSPLVSHLDQSAEEKFRTTMMLIQSTDNQALLKDAYDAAQKITDEKARAQALLDVVNEINYFTQSKSAS